MTYFAEDNDAFGSVNEPDAYYIDNGWPDKHEVHRETSDTCWVQMHTEVALLQCAAKYEFSGPDVILETAAATAAVELKPPWSLPYFRLRIVQPKTNAVKAPGEVRLIMPSKPVFRMMLDSASEGISN